MKTALIIYACIVVAFGIINAIYYAFNRKEYSMWNYPALVVTIMSILWPVQIFFMFKKRP